MFWLPPALFEMSEVAPVMEGPSDVPDAVFLSLAGLTALGWTVTYVLAIRQAFADGRMGIPAYMVAVNFAWEFSLTFVLEQTPMQRRMNAVWLVFNAVLLYQALRIGQRDHPRMSPGRFRWTFAGLVLWAGCVVVVGANEFGDQDGMYTGMIIQVPLSAAFIWMLRRRGSSAGQSMYIAAAKLVGSVFAGLTAFVLYPSHHLLQVLVPTYAALDIAYAVMLYRTMREEGRPPWAWRPAARPAAPAPKTPAGSGGGKPEAGPVPRAGGGRRSEH